MYVIVCMLCVRICVYVHGVCGGVWHVRGVCVVCSVHVCGVHGVCVVCIINWMSGVCAGVCVYA